MTGVVDKVPGAGATSWERRKGWPLLLGSAVTLGGLAAVNYSWANPDGRLTTRAQVALSEEFPDAKVRVHGRDAIITGLPPGADVDAAHELVRRIEGVRSVREDTAAAGETVAHDLADSTAKDSNADATVAVAAVDPAVASGATEAGVATTAAPTTATPATTAAPTTAATAAPVTTAPAVTPTTVAVAQTESRDDAMPETAPPMKILFDSVSSELTGESKTAVDELVAYLEANPDVRIKVVGHADGWGTRLTNLAVSRARAGSVVSALVSGGVGRDRISAFAHGDRLPVASNATVQGRAANRRVEIVFFGAEGTGDREVAFTG